MDDKDLHERKALSSMFVTEFPSMTEFRVRQWLNEDSPIETTELGIVMDFNFAQLKKALLPIRTIVLGMETEDNLLQK